MPKLNLGKNPILNSDIEEAIVETAEDLLDRVKQDLINLGLDLEYSAPDYEPPDLSEIATRADRLTTDELGMYHTQFTAFASYLGAQLGLLKASKRLASRNRKLFFDTLAQQLFAGKTPQAQVSSKIHSNPKYQEYELEELRLVCMTEILESQHKAYDDSAKAISRLITLSGQELEQTKRESNIPKRGKKGLPGGKLFRKPS